jgi:hypothetical protein
MGAIANLRKRMLVVGVALLALHGVGALKTRGAAPYDDVLDLLDPLAPKGGLRLRGTLKVEPIQVSATATTAKEVRRQDRAWCRRVWGTPFLQRAKGQPWEAAATGWIDQALAFLVGEPDETKTAELAQQGKQLIEAGCGDPLVLYLTGALQYKAFDDWRAGLKLYEAALPAVETNRAVSRALARVIVEETIKLMERAGHREHAALNEKLVAFTRDSLRDDSYRAPGDDVIFVRQQVAFIGCRLEGPPFEQLAAVYAEPAVPDWARHTLRGYVEVKRAWLARGTGWASTVADTGWKEFGERLKKARAELVQGWKLRPGQPEAAAEMIAVVMGGGGTDEDTERGWFDRAVAAQFDYAPAYSALMWAYRPRWCGSHEMMLAFGKACFATRRFDTIVPQYFFKACNDIASELDDCRPFFQRSDIAQPLMELSRRIVEDPAREAEREKNTSFYAVHAWLTGDYALAAKTLDRIGPNLHPEAARYLKKYYRSDEPTFRAEVAICNSPACADFVTAEQAYRAGDLTAASAAYAAALQKANLGTRPHLAARAGVANIERQLALGDWVKLTPDPALAQWFVRSGNWSVEPDGTLINHGNDREGLLVHQARVGPDFELRGEFEIVAKKHCCQKISIAFGWNTRHLEGWTTCRIGQRGPSPFIARIHDKYRDEGEAKVPIKLLPKNRFLFRCQDGRVTLELNGATVWNNFEPPDFNPGSSTGRVGFCNSKWCRMNTTYFRHLELRHLKPSVSAKQHPPSLAVPAR